MKKTIIALLLSLLLFPGTGHLYLKRFRSGAAFLIISLLALGYILYEIANIIMEAMNAFAVGNASGDPDEIAIIVNKQLDAGALDPIGMAIIVLLCCWVIASLDIIRAHQAKK